MTLKDPGFVNLNLYNQIRHLPPRWLRPRARAVPSLAVWAVDGAGVLSLS